MKKWFFGLGHLGVILSFFAPFLIVAEVSVQEQEIGEFSGGVTERGCKPPRRGPTGPSVPGPTGPTGASGLDGLPGPTGVIPGGITIGITGASGGLSATGISGLLPFDTILQSPVGNVQAALPFVSVGDSGFYYVHFVATNEFNEALVQFVVQNAFGATVGFSNLVDSLADTPVIAQQLIHLDAGDKIGVYVPSGGLLFDDPSLGSVQASFSVLEVAPDPNIEPI